LPPVGGVHPGIVEIAEQAVSLPLSKLAVATYPPSKKNATDIFLPETPVMML
jgi:hypothetical protein